MRDFLFFQHRHEVGYRPDMIGNPCGHRGRDSQRLMNPAEVVEKVMQGNRVFVIDPPLAESVCRQGTASVGSYVSIGFLPRDVSSE